MVARWKPSSKEDGFQFQNWQAVIWAKAQPGPSTGNQMQFEHSTQHQKCCFVYEQAAACVFLFAAKSKPLKASGRYCKIECYMPILLHYLLRQGLFYGLEIVMGSQYENHAAVMARKILAHKFYVPIFNYGVIVFKNLIIRMICISTDFI